MKALLLFLAACTPDPVAPAAHDDWDDKLAERVVDYNAALRVAALRLTGELPTLTELEAVAAGGQPAYETQIHAYLASPKLVRQMFLFWQDTMKLGGAPDLDSAPAFLAELSTQDRSYLEAFTAPSGTCPTYQDMAITPGDCANGGVTVGVLTHPGMNAKMFSNFGFRRVRWLQEVFECSKFPAEIATTATDVGGATPYTGMFPFASIADGAVNFLDVSSVVCANCHSNINHIAPLFAHYDANGQYQPDIAVPTPQPGSPLAKLTDYLPAGEPLAWRHDVVVGDMQSLGMAIAADPATARCAIARLWNWAMSKTDIVDGAQQVPADTIATQVDAFVAGGDRIHDALFRIYTSDDFVRF
jgi:hypothetical protein